MNLKLCQMFIYRCDCQMRDCIHMASHIQCCSGRPVLCMKYLETKKYSHVSSGNVDSLSLDISCGWFVSVILISSVLSRASFTWN